MINYLINTLLCGLVLYITYVLLLEKENMHRFKRVYLLFSLVFSMTIPLITLHITSPHATEKEVAKTIIPTGLEEIHHTLNEPLTTVVAAFENQVLSTNSLDFSQIFLVVYLFFAVLFLFRFLKNLFEIIKQTKSGELIIYKNAKIVLIKEKLIPHSFGKYIFINKEDFKNGYVTEEIIIHESSHIRQYHFLDVIFVELLIVFFWFNPIIYLFRYKIKLNHEFLADNTVIQYNNNIAYYQALLIYMADQQKSSIITSSFNFTTTKKRLIMMTKKTSKKKACCRQIALIPVFFAAVCFFTTKSTANTLPEQTSGSESRSISAVTETTINPGKGVSQEELNEYKNIVYKYLDAGGESESKKEYKWKSMSLSDEDFNRLYILYVQMDTTQRKSQLIHFAGPLTPVSLSWHPIVSTWNIYKKANTIFLDEEKVDATKLNAIGRQSIIQYYYKKESSCVYLWTKKGYDNYLQKYGQQISVSKLLEVPPLTLFIMGVDKSPTKQNPKGQTTMTVKSQY